MLLVVVVVVVIAVVVVVVVVTAAAVVVVVVVWLLLPSKVTTVKFRYWLNSLYQFSLSQSLISSSSIAKGDSPATPSELLPSLCKASAIVYNAMMLMKVIA